VYWIDTPLWELFPGLSSSCPGLVLDIICPVCLNVFSTSTFYFITYLSQFLFVPCLSTNAINFLSDLIYSVITSYCLALEMLWHWIDSVNSKLKYDCMHFYCHKALMATKQGLCILIVKWHSLIGGHNI